MPETTRGAVSFRVETLELDLAPLVGAFARRLHDVGVPIAPARAADLARALDLVRPVARRRLYWAFRAVCVTDPAHVPPFDRVFAEVFGGAPPRLEAPPIEEEVRTRSAPRDAPAKVRQEPRTRGAAQPGAQTATPRPGTRRGEEDLPEIEAPLTAASEEELLSRKRFDRIEPDELPHLYELMRRLRFAPPPRLARRYEKGRRGARVDMRRTLRSSLRTAGDPIRLARRQRRVERRRLVLLCDISGSMEPYARAYLQFLACAVAGARGAEAFVFATRLTRLTRALKARNPDRAIERAAAAAPDWSSGTRIGAALRQFNDRHGRRGMARGAVVVIVSDGWERGDPEHVRREMGRLGRLAHRIVWVNPRAAAKGFAVRSGGMAAALPYCDALVSGHTFEALEEVVRAIGAGSEGALAPLPSPVLDEDEPWASATPVPGSSVAMPSGYGPSRGRTTPGWTVGEPEQGAGDGTTGGGR